jgi:hypothetical protein
LIGGGRFSRFVAIEIFGAWILSPFMETPLVFLRVHREAAITALAVALMVVAAALFLYSATS